MKDARDKNEVKFIRHTCGKMCNEQCYLPNWRQGGEQELTMPVFNPSDRITNTLLHFYSLICKIQETSIGFFSTHVWWDSKRLDPIIKRHLNYYMIA